MNNIKITNDMIKPFESIWREVSMNFSQSDIELFYKIMPCKRKTKNSPKKLARNIIQHLIISEWVGVRKT